MEYMCHKRGLGFSVILTEPGETVITMRNSFRVSVLEDTRIAIKPKYMTTSDGLRNYKPNERQCFFSGERKLRFFNIYTQNQCEAECLSNFTLSMCGCVKFSMARDRQTNICGAAKITCYENTDFQFYREDTDGPLNENMPKSFRDKCNCLPACVSIKYDAEVDRNKYDLEILEQNFGISNKGWAFIHTKFEHRMKEILLRAHQIKGAILFHQFCRCFTSIFSIRPSRVSIFFRDHQVEKMKRREASSTTLFLASCGGLLGLFLGGSVLSIIEFIYFFTFRLLLNIRNSKSHNIVTPIEPKDKNTSPIAQCDSIPINKMDGKLWMIREKRFDGLWTLFVCFYFWR